MKKKTSRLDRIEMSIAKLAKQMNSRFDNLENRLDRVENRLDYIVKANELKDISNK